MNDKLKTFCFILITISIIVGIIFYCWDIYEEQRYYSQKQECIEKCFRDSKEEVESSEKLLKDCKEICNYDFIQSKIISD